MSDHDILIRAEHVSKKFCRSLKRSLFYGASDIMHAINPWSESREISGPDQVLKPEDMPTLRRDEFWAVKDINFELRRGECLGLIGHNGAGKSTLLKILNSLIKPDTGRITMRGRVCALIELNAGFNPILTGRENIYNQGALLGLSKAEIDKRFDEIVDFSELGKFIEMPVQNYSSGMKVRLGFAVAVQMEPDVLLLDEILAVGDVAFRFKCLNAMSSILSRSAVIFVSHSMPQVFRISSSVLLLEHGKIAYHGSNVSQGIDQYYALQKQSAPTVTGSGEATVEYCRTVNLRPDPNEPEASIIDAGNYIELELGIKLHSPVRRAVVQALIWNQELVPVAEIVESEGRGPVICAGEQSDVVHLQLRIPPLPLNAGKHYLSINILSPDLKNVYCRHDNAAIFHVGGANLSGANFIVDSEWVSKSPLISSPKCAE